jgi:hypothetical protein
MGLRFPTRESWNRSLLCKGKRWLCIIREVWGRKMYLLSGKSHGIIPDTRQTSVQIAAIDHQQQNSTVRFPVDDVLDEKNARQSTKGGFLKGGVVFYFGSAWGSRITELTVGARRTHSATTFGHPDSQN